jgi:hypothetical protein
VAERVSVDSRETSSPERWRVKKLIDIVRQVAEEIGLQRAGRAHAQPQRQQVVAEVEPALHHPDGHVGQAQEHDRAEAVVRRGDTEPAEDGGAEIAQGESADPAAGAVRAPPRARSRMGAITTGSSAASTVASALVSSSSASAGQCGAT